jgi:hypothetical protein
MLRTICADHEGVRGSTRVRSERNHREETQGNKLIRCKAYNGRTGYGHY